MSRVFEYLAKNPGRTAAAGRTPFSITRFLPQEEVPGFLWDPRSPQLIPLPPLPPLAPVCKGVLPEGEERPDAAGAELAGKRDRPLLPPLRDRPPRTVHSRGLSLHPRACTRARGTLRAHPLLQGNIRRSAGRPRLHLRPEARPRHGPTATAPPPVACPYKSAGSLPPGEKKLPAPAVPAPGTIRDPNPPELHGASPGSRWRRGWLRTGGGALGTGRRPPRSGGLGFVFRRRAVLLSRRPSPAAAVPICLRRSSLPVPQAWTLAQHL